MTFAKKMMTATAALALTAGAAFADEMKNPMVGGAEMFADKNIVENAVNSADHTTLVAAVKSERRRLSRLQEYLSACACINVATRSQVCNGC